MLAEGGKRPSAHSRAGSLPVRTSRLLAGALFSSLWSLCAAEPDGRDGCKCIEAFGTLNKTTLDKYTWVNPQTMQPCLEGTPPGANGERSCYPPEYGSSFCKAWDSNLPPDCGSADHSSPVDEQPWCQQTWCYVNPDDCDLQTEDSKYFAQSTGLAYSYHTCDSVDMFSPHVLMAEVLKGKTLRVGVPTKDPPWLTRTGEAPAGFTTDWLARLQAVGGFDVEVVPISEAAQNRTNATESSMWDACTWDVALQRLDMCYGAFWATDSRRAWTAFTPSYATDQFFLVVAAQEDDDIWTKFLKVFGPFNGGLWAAIAVSCAGIGWSLWLFGEIDSPGDKDKDASTTKLGMLKAGVRGTLLGTKGAFHAFLGQGRPKVKSKPAAVVLAGFSFLCMVGAASYTASLASFLLIGNLKSEFTDVTDALKSKAKICVPEQIERILTAKFPEGESENLWVNATIPTDMTELMDAGECDCMIFAQAYVDQMQAGVFPWEKKHCRKVKVGGAIVSVPLAAPIRSDLFQAIAYLWSQARFQGYYGSLMKKYPPVSSDCPPLTGLKAKFEALTPQDLSACFVFTWVAIAVAIAVHLVQKYVQERAVKFVERAVLNGAEPADAESPKVNEQEADSSMADKRDEPEITMESLAAMQVAQQDKMAALEDKVDKIEGKVSTILELLERSQRPAGFS